MGTSAVTYAGRVRPGDAVFDDAEFHLVSKVRRAQGRKPRAGENLHLVTDGPLIKVNSLQPVRIRPGDRAPS